MRIFKKHVCYAVLALVAATPAVAVAQMSGSPSSGGTVGTAPRGMDTPVTKVPGTVRSEPPNLNPPLPTVDSSGANRSNDSATGEVKPPIGAPRLPGEPINPPSGPDDLNKD